MNNGNGNAGWPPRIDNPTIFAYGGPPIQPAIPAPAPLIPNPMPLDPLKPLSPEDFAKLLGVPKPTLSPCAKCKRHIFAGSECPFCFVIALIKSERARKPKPPSNAEAKSKPNQKRFV